jgi:hypothetical protein
MPYFSWCGDFPNSILQHHKISFRCSIKTATPQTYHPKSDAADLYIPALLEGIFGSRQWMTALARKGGAAKSPAKSQASRQNGKKGGRPRKDAIG